jgi:uncharacterized protein (TIGR01777 family)
MDQKKRVLIAGGSGFVGEHLRRLFVSHYYETYILSTQKRLAKQEHVLFWSPYTQEIDLKGIDSFDIIINLAGAGVADKFWTKKRKEELVNSRVKTCLYLKELINSNKLKTNYFLQASAIGLYGDRGHNRLTEEASKGQGFLADLSEQWEHAIQGLNVPLSIIRIGIVFHPEAGAFPKLVMGLRFRFMVIFGNGRQYISWIDVSDLCEQIYFLSVRKKTGLFNAVAPQPVQFIYLLKKYNSKSGGISIPFSFPAFLLRWIVGDLSEMFLFSQKVCSRKIENLGFKFQSKTIAQFFKNYKKKF